MQGVQIFKRCKNSTIHLGRTTLHTSEYIFNDSEIKLPWLVTIKMQDKIRIRRMMSRDMQNSHVMIKQGITWYNPVAEIRTV